MSESKFVEIFGGTPGEKGRYIKYVYDQFGDKYFAPKETVDRISDIKNSGLKNTRNLKIAIFDTGLMLNHPLLRDYIEESVDFTGEGVEDLNGHGTIVALLALIPGVPILNVKVVDSEGRGSVENLIKGIQWLIPKSVGAELIANLSVGVYWKKWGLFDCNGTCKACHAVEQAANQGIVFVAVAGNTPDKTCCPARLALTRPHPLVLAVAANDLDYSGKGTISASGKVHSFVPIN